jgi:ankyrin repeat protein
MRLSAIIGLKMRSLSCALCGLAAVVLLSGALVDCCNCSDSDSDSDPASQDLGQSSLQEFDAWIEHAADYAEEVANYIEFDDDPNTVEEGSPIIVRASFYGNTEATRHIIESDDADVNLTVQPDTDGFEPRDPLNALHAAIEGQSPKIVRCLLKTNINRNATAGNGMTPLMYLVCHDWPVSADRPPANFADRFYTDVAAQLYRLRSGDLGNDSWLFVCADFVRQYMRPCDILELIRNARTINDAFVSIRAEVLKRLLPEKKDSFCKQIEDESRDSIDPCDSVLFMLPPNYDEEILQMLLQDNDVDLAATDKDGNTALHLAAECIMQYYCEARHYHKVVNERKYEYAVRRFQILREACLRRGLDFKKQNLLGYSVQDYVDMASESIRLRAQRPFEWRKRALQVGSAVAVLGIGCYFMPSARQYIVQQCGEVAGLFGKAWGACSDPVYRWWRCALERVQ